MWNRAAGRVSCLALALTATGAIGCGGSQQAANETAEQKLLAASTAADFDTATSAYLDAASTPDMSPAETAKTNYLAGQAKFMQANFTLDQAQEAELDIGRLLADMRLKIMSVNGAQAQIKADQGYDPSETETLLRAKIDGLQGADPAGGAPTLGELQDQISKLGSAIVDNRNQAKSLTDQRTALLDQADQTEQQSIGETGQQAVNDYAAAAELKRKAAELFAGMDKLDAQLVPIQADLNKVQAERTATEKLIADYKKEIDDLDTAWKGVQDDIDTQKQAIVRLAGSNEPTANSTVAAPSEGTAPPLLKSIAQEAAALKTMLASDRNLRDQATQQLKDALKEFTAAAAAGDQIRQDNMSVAMAEKTPPVQKQAITQLEETYSGSAARLAAAEVQRELGANYATAAILANNAMQTFAAAHAALGSDTPQAIQDAQDTIATPSVDDLASQADQYFASAISGFGNPETLPGPAATSRANAALAGKMIADFDAKNLAVALNKQVAGKSADQLQADINTAAGTLAAADSNLLPEIPFTLPPAGATPAQ
jgi:hypothetical protein